MKIRLPLNTAFRKDLGPHRAGLREKIGALCSRDHRWFCQENRTCPNLMSGLEEKGLGVLIPIRKVLQRLSPLQCPLCHEGTILGLVRTQRHAQRHTEHRSPCTCPERPWVLVLATHMEKAKSYTTANTKLLGLTWASKQPISLWTSPEMLMEHPWSYPYTHRGMDTPHICQDTFPCENTM